ncbi:L-seryl-tRNA(Sec) selenium transferase [bacterium]|nr:L-seryl-tRNA(Sec) selenium transferase [candidate division CSSED10-310 bacterium]
MNYRDIPSVNALLDNAPFLILVNRYGRTLVKEAIRDVLEQLRGSIETASAADVSVTILAERVMSRLIAGTRNSLIRVINATGTVLHTNLGRAPLAPEALAAVIDAAEGYSNLEFDLTTGKRGKRTDHVASILTKLTGAEAGIAVNNNAGAVLLTLTALARDREVIISRGELVEIGGGFRVPDVMAASGSILHEIGTTNRTHLRDYENAVSDRTALLMKAHRSNFDMTGFTSEITIDELVGLGKKHGIPVMYDLGSGCFFHGKSFGWDSPVVRDIVTSGIDIVTFSGDKLLGGPQAGIIVGRKHLIETIAIHPLARAMRLDKMTLAALDATLKLYLQPESTTRTIPTLRALTIPLNDLRDQALSLIDFIGTRFPDHCTLSCLQDISMPGGGSLPSTYLNTWSVSLTSSRWSAEAIACRLRQARPPVIARIQRDAVLFDMRTVSPEEVPDLATALSFAFRTLE